MNALGREHDGHGPVAYSRRVRLVLSFPGRNARSRRALSRRSRLLPEPTPAVPAALATLLESLGDAIVVTEGPTGPLVFANEGGAHLAGFRSPAELLAAPDGTWRTRVRLVDGQGEPLGQEPLDPQPTAPGEHRPLTW